MNLENIKRHGLLLGLEAEFTVQLQTVIDRKSELKIQCVNIKQSLQNCLEIVDEVIKVTHESESPTTHGTAEATKVS